MESIHGDAEAGVGSNTVIVFDFGLTLIDCDCDQFIMEFGLANMFEAFLTTLPWNSSMDKMMGEPHSQGRSVSDIEKAVKAVPLHPATASSLRLLNAMGCDLRIVSDANMYSINTILGHHRLLRCFTAIKTNPATVEENGRLRIKPYHPFTNEPPHGCPLCPPNMCKGAIVKEMMGSNYDRRYIYVGDGNGDFCPSLKLRGTDHVLPRKRYPLWNLIEAHCETVEAQVHGWSNALDMEVVLLKIILSIEVLKVIRE